MTKIYDFKNQNLIVEADDWRAYLAMWGYKSVETNTAGSYRFEIFHRGDDWAMYHPPIAGTDTEVVYAHIPGRGALDEVLDFAQQMANPITSLAHIRNMLNRPE